MLTHISFVSVPVDDVERAMAFYRDVLGMEVVSDAPGPFGRWVMLSVEGAETRVHLDQRPEGAAPPGKPVLVLISTDLDADCAAIGGRGGEVIAEPATAEWNPDMSRAILRDSEGNAILLTTP